MIILIYNFFQWLLSFIFIFFKFVFSSLVVIVLWETFLDGFSKMIDKCFNSLVLVFSIILTIWIFDLDFGFIRFLILGAWNYDVMLRNIRKWFFLAFWSFGVSHGDNRRIGGMWWFFLNNLQLWLSLCSSLLLYFYFLFVFFAFIMRRRDRLHHLQLLL